ncbi:MAG: YCF48-related protein [bacterium]|nr:YCF48-related protein [bacterium]
MRYAIGIMLFLVVLATAGVFLGTPQRAATDVAPTLSGGTIASGDRGVSTTQTITFEDANALLATSAVQTTWRSEQGMSNGFSDVAFTSSTSGYAVGGKNHFMSTIDGGVTWTHVVLSGASVDIDGISFADANTGWIVGASGTIYKTTDGLAWTAQTSGTAQNILDVYAVSATTVYAVGVSGTIIGTTDGGTTWTAQTSGTANDLWGIHCTSTTACVAVGASGTILTTANGGGTWTTRTSGVAVLLYEVACTGSTCAAIGDTGTIIRSTDSGATWTSVTSGTANALYGIAFGSATTGWAFGNNGTILKTADAGATWTAQTSGATTYLAAAFALDATTVWVSGGALFTTANGGTTWTANRGFDVDENIQSYNIHEISFADADTGWLASGTSDTVGGGIAKTTNGGALWTSQLSGLDDAFEGIDCPSTTFCAAVGRSGIIYTTTDGTTWTLRTSGIATDLLDVECPSVGTCYAFGTAGAILKTTNSGATWTAQTGVDAGVEYKDASCLDASTCTAVGGFSGVIHTDNGGTTWTSWNLSVNTTQYGIHCPSATTCWVVGSGGVIYRTTNSGASWTTVTSGTSNDLNDVYFPTANEGWAVGQESTILSTTNGGTTWTSATVAPSAGLPQFLTTIEGFGAANVWAAPRTSAVIIRPAPNMVLQRNSGNTQGGAAAGANLCTAVTVSSSAKQITCENGTLIDKTWYTLTGESGAGGILAADGTAMSADVTRAFYVENSQSGGTDTTPPDPPTNAKLVVSNFGDVSVLSGTTSIPATLTFTWTDPTATDYSHVRFVEYIGERGAELGNASGTFTRTFTLVNGTEYRYIMQAVDSSGNRSSDVSFVLRLPTEDPGPGTFTITVRAGQQQVNTLVPPPGTEPEVPTEPEEPTEPPTTTEPEEPTEPVPPQPVGSIPAPTITDSGSGQGVVSIMWENAPEVAVAETRIYRVVGGQLERRGTIVPPQTMFEDQDVVVGGAYQYAIRTIAVDGRQSSLVRAGFIVRGAADELDSILTIADAVVAVVHMAPCGGFSIAEAKWVAESFKDATGRPPTLTPSDLEFICALKIDPLDPKIFAAQFPGLRNTANEKFAHDQFVAFFGREPGMGANGSPLALDLARRDMLAVEFLAYKPKLATTTVNIVRERVCMRRFLQRALPVLDMVTHTLMEKPIGAPPDSFDDFLYVHACSYSGALLP